MGLIINRPCSGCDSFINAATPLIPAIRARRFGSEAPFCFIARRADEPGFRQQSLDIAVLLN